MNAVENRPREVYLDILKGLAMLLVVMQHVGGALDAGMAFMCKVDVPLFFVVSGYLAMKPRIHFFTEMKKKTWRIAIPFVAALLFAAFWYKMNVTEVLFDIGKCGYWFLQCLYLFFIIFYALHKMGMRYLIATGCVVEVVLLALTKFLPDQIDGLVGVSYMSRYFPCFIAGACIKHYKIGSLSRFVGTMLVLVACVGFTYNSSNTNLDFLLHVAAYLGAAVTVFYFLKSIHIPKIVASLFSYVGRHSLSVYILHFYFVQHLPHFTDYFLFNLVTTLAISLVVIALSLALEKILVSMTYINKIL